MESPELLSSVWESTITAPLAVSKYIKRIFYKIILKEFFNEQGFLLGYPTVTYRISDATDAELALNLFLQRHFPLL